MPKSIPSRNEIAAVLDGANFVVVQWGGETGDPCHCAVTAIAPPDGGYATGTDGRTYKGIVRHEQFMAGKHVDLVNMAAYGLQRQMEPSKRKLAIALQTDHGLTLPEAVAAIHQMPATLAEMIMAGGASYIAATLEHDHPNGILRLQADKAYENYDFGQNVAVEDADGWESTMPGDTWSRKVYCLNDGDQQTHTVYLNVRFSGVQVVEVYALDGSGNFVGKPQVELPVAA